MKKYFTGWSIVGLLFAATVALPGCGEKEYQEPEGVEDIEIDLGDGVPPLDGESN